MRCINSNMRVLTPWTTKECFLLIQRQVQAASQDSWTGGKIKTTAQAWKCHNMMDILKVAQQAHLRNDKSQCKVSMENTREAA